jgi:hypothetical protein
MAVVLVPFQLDEHLPELGDALPAGIDVIRGGEAGSGEPVVVVSGDCAVSQGAVTGIQRAGVDGPPPGAVPGAGGPDSRRRGPAGTRRRPRPRPAEHDYLTSSRVRQVGVTELNADALPEEPLVLHIDLDVVDSAEIALEPGRRSHPLLPELPCSRTCSDWSEVARARAGRAAGPRVQDRRPGCRARDRPGRRPGNRSAATSSTMPGWLTPPGRRCRTPPGSAARRGRRRW